VTPLLTLDVGFPRRPHVSELFERTAQREKAADALAYTSATSRGMSAHLHAPRYMAGWWYERIWGAAVPYLVASGERVRMEGRCS